MERAGRCQGGLGGERALEALLLHWARLMIGGAWCRRPNGGPDWGIPGGAHGIGLHGAWRYRREGGPWPEGRGAIHRDLHGWDPPAWRERIPRMEGLGGSWEIWAVGLQGGCRPMTCLHVLQSKEEN